MKVMGDRIEIREMDVFYNGYDFTLRIDIYNHTENIGYRVFVDFEDFLDDIRHLERKIKTNQIDTHSKYKAT